jgi:AraC-like DNA-binding protein
MNAHVSVAAIVRESIDGCNGSVAFSVKIVCANLHLSQSRMTQEFKKCYRKTILTYWSEVPLARACTLLCEQPERSVSSIAAELGYLHANNFTNWFTRRMGISPRRYIATVQSGAALVESAERDITLASSRDVLTSIGGPLSTITEPQEQVVIAPRHNAIIVPHDR